VFPIEYDDWKSVCSQMLIQDHRRKQAFLQWYPFVRLSKRDKEQLKNEEFFNAYIKTGFILYYPEVWHVTNNYLTKSDSNFRHASLVSPIMYLIVLAIGKSLARRYIPSRPNGVDVYYGGNFQENRLSYHKDYDIFYKRVNEIACGRQYYIKTDIKDFFPNINVNGLFNMVDENLQATSVPLSPKHLLVCKELFLYLGQGEFPLLDNCTTTSYLSTIIYLDSVDKNL
jgi:AbiA family abortive infection protein